MWILIDCRAEISDSLLDVDNIYITCTILCEYRICVLVCESVHTYACVHAHGAHTCIFCVCVIGDRQTVGGMKVVYSVGNQST